jgi:hypothetical protein
MNAITIPEFPHTELYLALCIHPRGEQIAIHRDGTITYHDSGLRITWSENLEPVAILHAEGDFDRSEWGIYRNDEAGCWHVENMVGSWDDSDDALKAAVANFGLTAEIQDELDRRVIEAAQEN